MTDSDLTLSLLRDIRDATRSNADELRGLKDEVRGTNERLDTLTGEVHALTGEVRVRLTMVENTVKEAAGQILMLGRYVKNKHEVAIDELRERVTRLEAKTSG